MMKTWLNGSKKFLLGFALLAGVSVAACSSEAPPTAPPTPAAEASKGSTDAANVMDLSASAETTRETGIVKWHLYTDRTRQQRMEGFDAQGRKTFTGRALTPGEDGVQEFHLQGGMLRVHPKRGVITSTLSPDAVGILGRLRADIKQQPAAARVPLTDCIEATSNWNTAAREAAFLCGVCAAQPETCVACGIALDAEANARATMDRICSELPPPPPPPPPPPVPDPLPPLPTCPNTCADQCGVFDSCGNWCGNCPPPPCDATCYSCGVNNGCGVYCGDCGGGSNTCVDEPCSDPCGCFDQCPQGCGG
jgi:hypothetical protein